MEEKEKEGKGWMIAAGAIALSVLAGSTAYIAGRTDQAVAHSRNPEVKDCYIGRVREAGQAAVSRVLICKENRT